MTEADRRFRMLGGADDGTVVAARRISTLPHTQHNNDVLPIRSLLHSSSSMNTAKIAAEAVAAAPYNQPLLCSPFPQQQPPVEEQPELTTAVTTTTTTTTTEDAALTVAAGGGAKTVSSPSHSSNSKSSGSTLTSPARDDDNDARRPRIQHLIRGIPPGPLRMVIQCGEESTQNHVWIKSLQPDMSPLVGLVQPGDWLVEINGISVVGESLPYCVDLLRDAAQSHTRTLRVARATRMSHHGSDDNAVAVAV